MCKSSYRDLQHSPGKPRVHLQEIPSIVRDKYQSCWASEWDTKQHREEGSMSRICRLPFHSVQNILRINIEMPTSEEVREKIGDLKLEVLYNSLWVTGILSWLVFKYLFSSCILFITISSVLVTIIPIYSHYWLPLILISASLSVVSHDYVS